MKIPALLLTVVVAALLITSANSQDGNKSSTEDDAKSSAAKIKELQQERIAILKTLAEVATKLYRNARVDAQDAYEANVMVFEAEFDAAEKEADRIALCENMVEVLKEYEQVTLAASQTAQATVLPHYRVKAKRLEVEIQLEKEKAQAARESK